MGALGYAGFAARIGASWEARKGGPVGLGLSVAQGCCFFFLTSLSGCLLTAPALSRTLSLSLTHGEADMETALWSLSEEQYLSDLRWPLLQRKPSFY